MRLDYLTIFPAYLEPLRLSLPGKAIEAGLLDVRVHDLRDWATGRHRTVDDTPYGGGAGMVMKPEPFGAAFADLEVDHDTTIVFTTPSGEPMSQALAHELAGRDRLLFACGRYEGIDQRVLDHARDVAEVREISLGDYVLNGGEVAALAITEAVVRLLPGFMGNAESLVEESHAVTEGASLLEYPVYTKPATWQERSVPEVLLSGDHGRIAAWRHQQQLERTAERRPDLLHHSAAATGWTVEPATPADAGELMTLMRACWVQEAVEAGDLGVPALHETLDVVRANLALWQTYVVRSAGRIVGSVRGRTVEATDGSGARWWDIGRLCVAPDLQGRGLGRVLLEHIQEVAPAEASAYWLFTGAQSLRNQRMYKKAGFRIRPDLEAPPLTVALTKTRRRPTAAKQR